jgi:hypothetical protein
MKKSVSASQKITIKLGRPKKEDRRALRAEPKGLYQNLVDVIVAAAGAAQAAGRSSIADLVFENVTTTVGFDVQRERQVGLKFELKIFGVGAKLGSMFSRRKTAAHEIELVFESKG